MPDDPRPARRVTHWRCAWINATRWGLAAAVCGLVATAIRVLR